MKTRRGWLRLRSSSRPRRPTLVELLQRYISQTDDAGPDWPMVVEDAVLRQDMEWVEDIYGDVLTRMKDIFDRIGPPPGWGSDRITW